MPRVAFTTLGCKVNQFETEVIEGLFAKRGYEIVSFDDTADVYVINTCSVTHVGEKKSRQLIRRAARLNPQALIVVTGCYAQIAPDQVASIPGVDIIIGTQDRHKIVDLVESGRSERRQLLAVSDIMQAGDFEDIPLLTKPGRTRAFLKIQEGCDNYCTYCIIPYTRGHLRSRPLASVVDEATKLAAAGFKEIVLTGIHLGAYGRDIGGLSLHDAVVKLLEIPELSRIRLSSLESIEVSEELIEIMLSNAKVCRHLHLPLQAGSNDVLRRMNRHYSIEEYRRQINGLMNRVPDLAITTDIIVGFPGETDEIFSLSLDYIAQLDLAKIHVFPYSPRSGTPAASYPDQVTEEVKKRRTKEMQKLGEKLAKNYRSRFIARESDVLFETEANGILEGLTGNYLRVYVKGSDSLIGEIRTTKLIADCKDGLTGILA